MRLAGQAEVSAHVDSDYYWVERVRVHVPIRTQPGVRFECGGQAIHMGEGECWIFDTWREHRVLNEGDQQRIHLVADTVGGAEFWALVEQGRAHDARPQAWAVQTVAPDRSQDLPALRCERNNLPQVMTPWELHQHLLGFNAELADPQAPHSTQIQLVSSRLVRAWRGLWAQHGDSIEGRADYRDALQAFIDALPEAAMSCRLRNGSPWFRAVVAGVLKPAVRD